MGLEHAVVTSVNRDDQPDGGAAIFAADHPLDPPPLARDHECEVLIPDFKGNWDALATVVDAQPEILNHNTETVPRLYRRVRPKARYERTLELLGRARRTRPRHDHQDRPHGRPRRDAGRAARRCSRTCSHDGVDVLTVGQYLRPSEKHLPVVRYYHPDEFAELREQAIALGFRHVEAGPLVRSSYHAERQVGGLRARTDLAL